MPQVQLYMLLEGGQFIEWDLEQVQIFAKLVPITYIWNLSNMHLILMNKQWKHILVQFQFKLFYCGKGRQNFASNVNLDPCERSRQNHMKEILREFGKFLFNFFTTIWLHTKDRKKKQQPIIYRINSISENPWLFNVFEINIDLWKFGKDTLFLKFSRRFLHSDLGLKWVKPWVTMRNWQFEQMCLLNPISLGGEGAVPPLLGDFP